MDHSHDQHVMCMDHICTDHVTHGPSRSHGEALPWALLDMGAYMGAYLSDSNIDLSSGRIEVSLFLYFTFKVLAQN